MMCFGDGDLGAGNFGAGNFSDGKEVLLLVVYVFEVFFIIRCTVSL